MVFRANKEQLRQDRERTGEILDQVDAWIADGVLNGDELRSPDLAVASSLALVEYIVALQPELRRRPLNELVERVFSGSGAARGRA
jgi:glutathione S-transferase